MPHTSAKNTTKPSYLKRPKLILSLDRRALGLAQPGEMAFVASVALGINKERSNTLTPIVCHEPPPLSRVVWQRARANRNNNPAAPSDSEAPSDSAAATQQPDTTVPPKVERRLSFTF